MLDGFIACKNYEYFFGAKLRIKKKKKNNIYLDSDGGVENAINNYLRLKFLGVWGGFLYLNAFGLNSSFQI